MSVNKEHTMSTYSKHSILGDTRINITNYVSFIRVYFNESFLNLIIIQKQLIDSKCVSNNLRGGCAIISLGIVQHLKDSKG